MNKKKICGYSLLNAIGTFLYIVLVVLFVNIMDKFESRMDETLIFPIAILMLLVLSVSLVGSLIFGRPFIWLLNGKKHEAVLLFICTLGIFILLFIIVFLILIAFAL